jgi:hypothetical protein
MPDRSVSSFIQEPASVETQGGDAGGGGLLNAIWIPIQTIAN